MRIASIPALSPGLDPLFLPAGGNRGRGASSSDPSRRDARRVPGTGRVLLLGRIRELALYRSEYLRTKGFAVIAPTSQQEAVDFIHRGTFDAAILTYTLSSELVLEYADMIRQNWPHCPVVVIANSETEDRRVKPDVVVMADGGPEALLTALRRVLRNRLQ